MKIKIKNDRIARLVFRLLLKHTPVKGARVRCVTCGWKQMITEHDQLIPLMNYHREFDCPSDESESNQSGPSRSETES